MDTYMGHDIPKLLRDAASRDTALRSEMDDADRRALAAEILVAYIRIRAGYQGGQLLSDEDLARKALKTAAVIYPVAPSAEQHFATSFADQLSGETVPPPAAAREGIEAVAPRGELEHLGDRLPGESAGDFIDRIGMGGDL